jgi:ATP-dependent Clp protease protease subunit
MKTHIVWGPPASGKTTYVNDNKGDNDVIFDFDNIMRVISGLKPHEKNDGLIEYVLDIRELMINRLKNETRFDNAWIIVTWVDDDFKSKFEGFESVDYILMETSKEECIKRVNENEDRQTTKDEQIQVIEEWFEKYEKLQEENQNNAQGRVIKLPKAKKFWKFQAKADKTGELLLYGEISSVSWYGDEVTPKEFKKDLDALGDIDILNIYVNSPGGDVFAAHAMVNILERNKAEKNIHVDGLMASASTFFIGVGKVFMPSNAMMMYHNPSAVVWGNANEMRKMADDLDKVRESMLVIYRDKTGMTDEEIIAILDAETWMTAEEAVDYGFADELEEEKKVAASINNTILIFNGIETDMSKFIHPESIIKKFIAFSEPVKPKDDPITHKDSDPVTDPIIPVPPKDPEESRQVPVDLYQKLIKNHERGARL